MTCCLSIQYVYMCECVCVFSNNKNNDHDNYDNMNAVIRHKRNTRADKTD